MEHEKIERISELTRISREREPEQWIAYPTDDTLNRLVQTREGAMTMSMHDMAFKDWRDPCVLPYKDGYLMVTCSHLGKDGALQGLYQRLLLLQGQRQRPL